VRRGEIWWARLGAARGSEPGFKRPVVIVQSNEFNDSRIATVLCAVVTSNTRLAAAPGNVLLKRRDSGLRRDSVVNVSQILTLDKRFLEKRVKPLSAGRLRELDGGLRLALAL
jgi:mRNA interferase MazF